MSVHFSQQTWIAELPESVPMGARGLEEIIPCPHLFCRGGHFFKDLYIFVQ